MPLERFIMLEKVEGKIREQPTARCMDLVTMVMSTPLGKPKD